MTKLSSIVRTLVNLPRKIEKQQPAIVANNTDNAEEITIGLFEDLGNVLEHVNIGFDITKLQLKSPIAKLFASYCIRGRSVEEAFFLVCEAQGLDLRSIFFGSIRPTYDAKAQELIAIDRGRTLRVSLRASKDSQHASSIYIADTVIIYTDFKSFSLYKSNSSGQILHPFAIFNTREMCEEIAFTGSIWSSIYPMHYAIVSRTQAYTFAYNTTGALFSTKPDKVQNLLHEERDAYKRLKCFDSNSTKLLSLDALRLEMQSCSRPPKLLSERKQSIYTIRRYSPQRSSLFDFGEPAEELSRGDFVTTYNASQEEFHREFFLSPHKWEKHEGELQLAAFDILHMLAIRRSKLFRIGFASSVYNIVLPPVLLIDEFGSSSYALFPCLNLYRVSKQTNFRRTLSMTFLTSPIEILLDQGKWSNVVSRIAPLEELHRLKDDLLSVIVNLVTTKSEKKYRISGPLKPYLGLSSEATIPELLETISKAVLYRILSKKHKNNADIENIIDRTSFISNLESKMATMVLQVEWNSPKGFTQPWERWFATGDDIVFSNNLFRTLFYGDYFTPNSADASRRALQFKEFNVGDTTGADITGMTLYNSQDSLKFVFYPKTCEKYPNFSMVRWMAWQTYIDSALTSLRALIYKFHPILNDDRELYSIIGTLNQMVQEFVDFYYLDLRDYFYRKEYEKLRTLMKVDTDYVQLLSKLDASKEEASLREQRLINKLVISLTLVTVLITVVSTLSQIGILSVFYYLIFSLILSVIGLWIPYFLFDPIRRSFKLLYHAINRLWR